MTEAASQWARKLFGFGPKEDANPHGLPFLPSPRRSISPNPSSNRKQGTFRMHNGPFFGRLPLELRQKILISVFGGRPLHIDLEFAHSQTFLSGIIHKNIFDMELQIDPRDTAGSESWRWRGCVCHRNEPVPGKNKFVNELWTDQCLGGIAFGCHLWPDDFPDRCQIQVMGWLLSCRQAYLEGTEILYSTNIFVVDNRLMTQNLTKLLSPRSLSLISSLEISWEVEKPAAYNSQERQRWPEPVDLPFKLIASTFPSLKTLHISLYGDMLSTGEADIDNPVTAGVVAVREQVLFRAVDDDLYGGMMNLQNVYVALNWTLWTQLRTQASRQKGYVFEERGYPGPRFWRPSAGSEVLADRGCWVVEGRHGW